MHTGVNDINPYLQQEVMSASPVRLRWMLIKRAEDLAVMVGRLWGNEDFSQANQWFLRIREILGELLDGVKDEHNPLSSPISDFYLYLLQMTFAIERTRDSARLKLLGELLAIESETWRLVLEKLGNESLAASESKSIFPDLSGAFDTASGESFSLEA